MSAKTEPNPNWVNAPFEEIVWDLENGFRVNRVPPIQVDGNYHNEAGEIIFIVKDGKVIIP